MSSTPQPESEWVLVTTIPALIAPDIFAAVQRKLAQNQAFARRNNTQHTYLLRALVSCGRCRLACVGFTSSAGYSYYRCSGKTTAIQSRREERCHARQIPARQ